jgi:succinate dehydrogenase/fumarate reductase flavoprotein subunit
MGVEHSISKGSPASYKTFPGADAFGQITIKGFGIQFLTTMKTQLEKRGIEILFETPAAELIQDPENREIIGVYAMHNMKKIAIKARKGVILCTGGFEFNEEMKANFIRPFPLKFSGWPYNTGDGIKMAQKVGADLWHMNTIAGYLNIWVPEYKAAWLLHFYRGIWVNKYGKRYTNEGIKFTHNWWLKNFDFNLDEPGYSSIPTYLIFDENIRKQSAVAGVSASDSHGRRGLQTYPADMGGCPEGWSRDNQMEIDKGWIKTAGSFEELGKTIGGKMDPQALATTMSNYNRYCEQKYDPEFGRTAELLEPLVTPPFYACALYPGGINTCGGPRRNAYGQVLDPYKRIIPRLYSAGEMGSICGNIYALGGLNAGEMLASGRLAGKNAAGLSNWD